VKRLIAFSLAIVFAGVAHGATLENYFACSLVEGKTVADVVALKNAYQADLTARYKGYTVKVLVPMYVGDEMAGADVVWFGTFQSADLDSILTWFRASDWPAKFNAVLKCSTSSLWTAM